MYKKSMRAAVVFFVVILVLLAHFGAKIIAVETFGFAASAKEIYLTFDDGPSTVVTGRILDTLRAENVKATFFVVGDRVGGREEVLRRIAAEGHTVGVHSMTHRYDAIYSSDEAFLKDIDGCTALIEQVAGVQPSVYRFPGGGKHEHFRALAEKKGYRVVGWNAVCGDEEIAHATARQLVDETVATAAGKQRVVLLLHDSATHAATAEALPAIIAHFREAGYAFCAF